MHSQQRSTILGIFIVCVFLNGCDEKATTKSDPSKTENNRAFHKEILAAAEAYHKWSQVDGTARWAPELCAAPLPRLRDTPKVGRISESTDAKTHGRKMYLLYARHTNPGGIYITKGKAEQVGQVIVKESWKPAIVNPEELKKTEAYQVYGKSVPVVLQDGKTYHATEQGDLFIMLRLAEDTKGTDKGWVYGTVTPDGKTVTSAGRVKTCMRCHQRAKEDRRFGLPAEKPSKP